MYRIEYPDGHTRNYNELSHLLENEYYEVVTRPSATVKVRTPKGLRYLAHDRDGGMWLTNRPR